MLTPDRLHQLAEQYAQTEINPNDLATITELEMYFETSTNPFVAICRLDRAMTKVGIPGVADEDLAAYLLQNLDTLLSLESF